MREIILLLSLASAIIATTYIGALLGLAVTGCLMFLKYVPEWTWTVVLLALTVATVRGLRYERGIIIARSRTVKFCTVGFGVPES